jgi:hypothetical protein
VEGWEAPARRRGARRAARESIQWICRSFALLTFWEISSEQREVIAYSAIAAASSCSIAQADGFDELCSA